MANYRLPVVVERDDDGYVATCPSLQGCYAQGETYEQVMVAIEDAIRLHLADHDDVKDAVHVPQATSLTTVEIDA